MLVIDPTDFAYAVERLMIAARTARDERGMRVFVQTPTVAPIPLSDADAAKVLLHDTNDWPRIQAIVLGAIVALANGPCRVGDQS